MVNLEGELIGLNSNIISPSGFFAGIAFAIPSDMLIKISNEIKEYGRVRRGWMGVSLVPVQEEFAKSMNIEGKAIVAQVLKDSPAESAGIQVGDVITLVNGVEVSDVNRLINEVANVLPGERVEVEVVRDDQKVNITVITGERPVIEKPILSR